MTPTDLKNNVKTRVDAIDTEQSGVGDKVITILGEEIDAYVKDLTIKVTVPSLTVIDGSTNSVTVTATIE